MNFKFIFSLLIICLFSFGNAQKVIVKTPPINNTKKMKTKIAQKFNFQEAMTMMKPGYIQTKWVPHNSANKDMKVTPKKIGEKSGPNEGDIVCNTVSKKLDVNSASFMNSTSDLMVGKIYAGAIYPADDFLKGNYNREIKKNRTPIRLKSTDSRFKKSISVKNPNEYTIDDGRKELLAQISDRDKYKSNNLESKYRMFYSSNEAMTGFLLSAGAAGYGVKVNTSVSTKDASSKVYLTIDAYKSVYALDALSEGDNEYFTELPAGIKANNLIMVNTVVYGTRIIANLTIDCKSSEDAFALAAAYSGFGFGAKLNVEYMKRTTNKEITLNYKQVGGENRVGNLTTTIDNLQYNIDQILNNTNYHNASPISYNIRDLEGNNMGIQSTVDKYDETVCFKNLPVDKIFVKIRSGKDGKNDDDYLHIKLYESDNYLVAEYDQPRKIEFRESSWSEMLPLKIVSENATSSHFKRGGRLHIYADHKGGKDDWYIDQVRLYIYLKDGSLLVQDAIKEAIEWNNAPNTSIRYITKDNPKTDLHFNGNLEGKP